MRYIPVDVAGNATLHNNMKKIKTNPFTHQKINVDKVLNDIKRQKRATKLVITNFKDWDILDGRTKQDKPLKVIAKIADFSMYVLSCAALSAIIIYVIFQ